MNECPELYALFDMFPPRLLALLVMGSVVTLCGVLVAIVTRLSDAECGSCEHDFQPVSRQWDKCTKEYDNESENRSREVLQDARRP